MSPTQKSCSANGNPGCIRGFVRDRCRKCDLGSVACDMCLPLPSPPSPSSSSPTALFFKQNSVLNPNPRRNLSFDPTPVSVSPVNKPRQPLPILPLSSPVSAPTSLTSTYAPSEPSSRIPSSSPTSDPLVSPCIYCRNGRKPCEDCFGLGYVQRICQDCIRERHRRHNSIGGIGVGIGAIVAIGGGNNNGGRRKSSLPSTWSQMGGGWSRFKEQLLQSASLKTPMSDTPDGAVVQSAIEQEPLQIEEETSREQRSDLKKFEFMKMFQGSQSISSTSASAPTLAPSSTHIREGSKSGERISFKATVMKHLKVPPLFSNSNNTNSNGSNDQTERSKLRLRQWSASLFTPSLLRSASTAA